MKKYIKILLYCHIIILLVFIFTPSFAIATDTGLLPDKESGGSSCPSGYTGSNCGNYSLNDMLSVTVKLSTWILGIVGSLSLLMFVYGGVMFLISGGNNERVEKGKQIIIGSVIGLIIVFASYTIIRLVFTTAGLDWKGKQEFPTAATQSTDSATAVTQ